CIQHTHIPWTF
nr:immunoglobulin light chain junction region [Macaca mulatta]